MKTLSDAEKWLESYETFTAADLRSKNKLLCYIRKAQIRSISNKGEKMIQKRIKLNN